jgi:competence protein ComFB
MQVDGLIRNFYEKLVLDVINHQAEMISLEEDQWADVACVSLNQLPSRYFRHSVDMAFYLSSEEYSECLGR